MKNIVWFCGYSKFNTKCATWKSSSHNNHEQQRLIHNKTCVCNQLDIEPASRNQQVVGGKGQKRKRSKKEVVKAPRKRRRGTVWDQNFPLGNNQWEDLLMGFVCFILKSQRNEPLHTTRWTTELWRWWPDREWTGLFRRTHWWCSAGWLHTCSTARWAHARTCRSLTWSFFSFRTANATSRTDGTVSSGYDTFSPGFKWFSF